MQEKYTSFPAKEDLYKFSEKYSSVTCKVRACRDQRLFWKTKFHIYRTQRKLFFLIVVKRTFIHYTQVLFTY